MPMPTSEIRKLAFRVAVEFYESASGDLAFRDFDVADLCGHVDLLTPDNAESVAKYLYSTAVMRHMYLGSTAMEFTPEGIRAVEASMDRPEQPQGPFPAYNVAIGNIGAGAQVALGHGTYTQNQADGRIVEEVRHLVALIQVALADWPDAQQQEAANARALLEGEATSPAPDQGMVRAAAKKVGAVALKVAETTATQAMLGYLKALGLMP